MECVLVWMRSALIYTAVFWSSLGCSAPAAVSKSPDPKPVSAVPHPERPIALNLGDGIELGGDQGTFSVKLATPTGKERFGIVLASLRLDGGPASYRYRWLSPSNAAPRPAQPVKCKRTFDRARLDTKTVRDAHSLDAAPNPIPSSVSPGDMRTFLWGDESSALQIRARAVLVGERSVVWADASAHHAAVLDSAFAAEFQKDFETLILSRARSIFGPESDVDRDGRIALLFSPMTRMNATVAFFRGCDLSPKHVCPSSNEAEILYLSPPNAIDPPYNTPRAIKEILAHELEHLLHHNRKVLRNSLKYDPDSAYLLEGFGALAQDVLGFQSGNLYVAKAGLDEIDRFSLGAVLAENGEYDRARDGALRGGAYLFVRWLYDQAGGDRLNDAGSVDDLGGPSLVSALLDSPRSVASELSPMFSAPLADLAMDFYSALALSNRDISSEPCFSFKPIQKDTLTGRQRGTDLFAAFHGMRMNGVQMQSAAEADGVLLAGGAEFLLTEVAAGPMRSELSITLAIEPSAMPRVRVFRME